MGLIARVIEEAGIPTTSVTSARSITALVKAPRAVFVNFPLGHTTGPAFAADLQRDIVRDALKALTGITEPGTILDLPYEWPQDPRWDGGPRL